MDQIIQSVIVGCITGLFAGGAVWGVIKTEMKYMRRDIDEMRIHLGIAK